MKGIKLNKELIKKYDYNVNEVIGIKRDDKNAYILYADKKLIRRYRGNLKSKALLSSYIPIEEAVFYSFTIEKNILNGLETEEDLYAFIETKVYDEAGVDETDSYLIKYDIVDKLKDEKSVVIECIIVSENKIREKYDTLLEKVGYIDYLSFPAFAFKALYAEGIIKKANDLFVVAMFDKVFLTFYSQGELLYMTTLTGGLDKLYENLKSLKIHQFNKETFKKLLTKKGVNPLKYSSKEEKVLRVVRDELSAFSKILQEQILKIVGEYDIESFERIFITTEYGEVLGIKEYLQELLEVDVFGFDFYEKYNLDRLPVDPFLFLGMLEAYHAYKSGNLTYNFSKYLRKPTFFYRRSGQFILFLSATLLIAASYPIYLYVKDMGIVKENRSLMKTLTYEKIKNRKLAKELAQLENKIKKLKEKEKRYREEVLNLKKLINTIYEYKFSYIPKSQEIVDITKFLNRYDVYVKAWKYEDNFHYILVYSPSEVNISKMIDMMIKNGFMVYFDKIIYDPDSKNYITLIKVKV